jgi:hypothetical protein
MTLLSCLFLFFWLPTSVMVFLKDFRLLILIIFLIVKIELHVVKFHFFLLCLSGNLIKAMTENDSLTLLSKNSHYSACSIFYSVYLTLL